MSETEKRFQEQLIDLPAEKARKKILEEELRERIISEGQLALLLEECERKFAALRKEKDEWEKAMLACIKRADVPRQWDETPAERELNNTIEMVIKPIRRAMNISIEESIAAALSEQEKKEYPSLDEMTKTLGGAGQ